MANCNTGLAVMGFFGAVVLKASGGSAAGISGANGIPVRVTNSSLGTKQAITPTKLVDGLVDHSAYALGGLLVGGSLSFPLVYGAIGASGDPMATMKALWLCAIERDIITGRMKNNISADVRYTNQTIFNYGGLQVNSFDISVKLSAGVDVTMDLLGISRTELALVPPFAYPTRNSKVVTWNNVSTSVSDYDGNLVAGTDCSIRNLSIKVANNVARFYSLNGLLTPVDVTAGKRLISGDMTLLGRNTTLGNNAFSNQPVTQNSNVCSANGVVGISIAPCVSAGSSSSAFGLSFPGVAFEIEDMGLTTLVFLSKINWHSMPGLFFAGDTLGANGTANFIV